MSQRLGMADGRCFTINTASTLLNDYIMKKYGISYENNYAYRQLLQSKGDEIVHEIQAMQQSGRRGPNMCQSCDKPLLKIPDTY